MNTILEKATYGIESEYYSKLHQFDLEEDLTQDESQKIKVDEDESLDNSKNGVELKFSKGIPRNQLPSYFDTMKGIIDRTILNHGQYNGYTGKCKKTIVTNSTGLHVHIGLNVDYMGLDVVRLIHLTAKHHDKICELAWRTEDSWAASSTEIIDEIRDSVNEAYYDDDGNAHIDSDKDYGLNIMHLESDGYGTIEFRYAHSSLAQHPYEFNQYLTFMESLIDEAFTGCDTFEADGLMYVESTIAGKQTSRTIEIHDTNTGNSKTCYSEL